MTSNEYQLTIFENAVVQNLIDDYMSKINVPQLMAPVRFSRKMKLFGYQEFWVREALAALDTIIYDKYFNAGRIQGFGNTDGCGLGKTIQTIELALRIWETKPDSNYPCLVICPKNCKRQWAQKIREYVDDNSTKSGKVKIYNNPSVLSMIGDGDNEDRRFFILMHYEQVRGDIESFIDENYMFSSVIIDEAHRIRNRGTGIYKAIKQLQTKYFITATATPWHRNPAELWTTLNLHAPTMFTSYNSFEYEHTLWRNQSAIGVRNHKKFADVISRVIIGRTKAELGVEKPIKDIIEIEMTPSQRKAYEKIRAGANIIQSEDGDYLRIKNYLSEIIRRQQVTSHPPIIGFRDSDSAKLEWVREFFSDHSEDEEVERDEYGNIVNQEQYLVFFRFKASCQEAVNMLREMGERVAHLASGTNAKDNFDAENDDTIYNSASNNSAKDDFEFGRARILCSVIESGGTGLDFRNMPHVTTIFYDIHWSTIKMTQAIDRSHGITSPETRHVMYLIVPETVDELIYKSMVHNWTEQKLVQEFLSNNNKY